MNNFVYHYRLFEVDKAVLANFFKRELNALIHTANGASVQAPQTPKNCSWERVMDHHGPLLLLRMDGAQEEAIYTTHSMLKAERELVETAEGLAALIIPMQFLLPL